MLVPVEIPVYEVLDERFSGLRGDLELESLFRGCRWAEGPAYHAGARMLIWSDIPNNRLLRWDETNGAVGVFRQPAGHPNGNKFDEQGRLITCEHSNRRITRTEHDGSLTVLADSYRGQRLNSPNDVVIGPGGALWFTDASYGIDSDYEGIRADPELDECYVFRADPASGACEVVADGFLRPTGIAFSPDAGLLYVADSRANHIRRFRVHAGSKLSDDTVFAVGTAPSLDSMRLDTRGRVWVACSDGVRCYDQDGTHLGTIRTPGGAANVEFGGPRRNRLFICAGTSLLSIMLTVNGAGSAAMSGDLEPGPARQ